MLTLNILIREKWFQYVLDNDDNEMLMHKGLQGLLWIVWNTKNIQCVAVLRAV